MFRKYSTQMEADRTRCPAYFLHFVERKILCKTSLRHKMKTKNLSNNQEEPTVQCGEQLSGLGITGLLKTHFFPHVAQCMRDAIYMKHCSISSTIKPPHHIFQFNKSKSPHIVSCCSFSGRSVTSPLPLNQEPSLC